MLGRLYFVIPDHDGLAVDFGFGPMPLSGFVLDGKASEFGAFRFLDGIKTNLLAGDESGADVVEGNADF